MVCACCGGAQAFTAVAVLTLALGIGANTVLATIATIAGLVPALRYE